MVYYDEHFVVVDRRMESKSVPIGSAAESSGDGWTKMR